MITEFLFAVIVTAFGAFMFLAGGAYERSVKNGKLNGASEILKGILAKLDLLEVEVKKLTMIREASGYLKPQTKPNKERKK
jgi:hypothetical protein